MDDRLHTDADFNDLPFEFRKKQVPDNLQAENWKAVEIAIQQEETPVRKLVGLRTAMAAASVVLVTAGIWWFAQQTVGTHLAMTKVKTDFGEIKHIILPDSSVVVLNANSSISIPEQWKEEGDRQVWLEGEAYFQVQKKPVTKQKFVVHTSQVDVEVLGTKFNVNTRREHSIVSLEEGKVQLVVQGKVQDVMEKKPPILMKPGQTVMIDETRQVKINEDKDVVSHSGWSRNEFHFDNTSFQEVARIVEDMYGYKIEAKDTTLLQRSISGDLRAANIQELVQVLEVTLKLKMTIENKTIQVSKP